MMFRGKEIAGQVPGIDVVVFNEGEEAMVEIVDAFVGQKPLDSIKGILLRKDNTLIDTGPRPKIENIDLLPFPTREKGTQVYTIISSRGCYCDCSFCSVPPFNKDINGKDFRIRSIESLESELDELNKLGARAVAFVDDSFLLPGEKGLERVEKIAGIMERYSFQWAFGCRPPELTEEIVSYCRPRGLKNVAMGIESGSEEVLRRFNKKTTTADSRRAIGICREFDLSITPYFIMFEPDMTMEDVRKNIDFLAGYGMLWPLPAGNVLVPYPGTPVYHELSEQGRIIENNHQFQVSYKYPEVERYMNRVVSTLRKAINVEYKLKKMEFGTDMDEGPGYAAQRKKVRACFDELSRVTWKFMNDSLDNPIVDYSGEFLESINIIDKCSSIAVLTH